eukprot:CAMPEP_0119526544 /NCGR_PEP_ID=MMETSP1344-20130328/41139_1 /TAXON_ID=236787 /ORGANISM="Florenciella parvula, Strain CCMP2471" /LENGTH=78 /DNA_ID=CAMNT_0007565561 /DNA_START=11 /DNA_END=244 /DNA_ORIENTATION=+
MSACMSGSSSTVAMFAAVHGPKRGLRSAPDDVLRLTRDAIALASETLFMPRIRVSTTRLPAENPRICTRSDSTSRFAA